MKNNIVLIGMPSSGKTTTGKVIADIKGMNFVDTDRLIEKKSGISCRDIVRTQGLSTFLEIQQEAIMELNADNHVIATGGGAIYSEAAMGCLKKDGFVAFLKLDYEELMNRLEPGRRFARNEGQSMADVYKERMPLYEKYADIIINCSGKRPDEIAKEIIDAFEVI